jgi:hypothetical protein
MEEAAEGTTSAATDASETTLRGTAEMASGAAAIAQTATDMLAGVMTASTRALMPDAEAPNSKEPGARKDSGNDFA